MLILAPVSLGELIDKVTILQLKLAAIAEPDRRENVAHELALLEATLAKVWCEGMGPLRAELKAVNRTLWDIEDEIRRKEARAEFDAGFVALARSVYRTNDERARLKRQINLSYGSAVMEEKSYA